MPFVIKSNVCLVLFQQTCYRKNKNEMFHKLRLSYLKLANPQIVELLWTHGFVW
jgi:hypothetical protein